MDSTEKFKLETLKASVYKVLTADGTGSSFYLKDKNWLVTNYHVIEGYREVALESFTAKRYQADVILCDPHKDIAFLRPQGLPDSENLELDPNYVVSDRDEVLALGFPLGMNCTFTQGIISNTDFRMNDLSYIQTDAAINPGNSGGPLLNQKGGVIGINSRKMQDAENIGFSIPIRYLSANLEKMSQLDTTRYSVLCTSCENQLFESSEHCPHCGFQIDSERYFRLNQIDKAAMAVESLIKAAGYNPTTLRSGKNYWELVQDKMFVRMFFYNQDYFYATSPIVQLPKKELDGVLNFLNSENQFENYWGIDKSNIFYSFRRYAADLFVDSKTLEIQKEFVNFIGQIGQIEKLLIETYQCKEFETLQSKISS